jgi:hypothetical protein
MALLMGGASNLDGLSKLGLKLLADLSATASTQIRNTVEESSVEAKKELAALLAQTVIEGGGNPFVTDNISNTVEGPNINDLLPEVELVDDEISTDLANIAYDDIMNPT